MAGFKVSSASLKDHAAQAKKAGKQGQFSTVKTAVPKIKAGEFTGDGSDTSSDSSSDSESDDDDDDLKKESALDFGKRITQSQTPSKTNGAKTSKTTTPAKKPTVNSLPPSSQKVVKKEATSSSDDDSGSDNESESDSDSSSDHKGKKSMAKTKSPSKPETSSTSKPKAKSAPMSTTKAKSPIKKESTTTSDAESSSAESDSESQSEGESEAESESDSEDAAQQIEEQIKNDVETATSQSSRSQSLSKEPSTKKPKHRQPASEDEDGDVEMVDQSLALTNGGNPTNVGDVPEFVAPDFHLRKLDASVSAADVAGFFSKAQLEGKQVWYITAPASLPVTVVQDLSIPIDQAQKGLPVLNHNGDDYRVAFDNPAASSSFRLLIPNKNGDKYSLLEHPVNQTMHFTRSETFPPEGPASVVTTQTISTTKPARPQPEGLRARYTPLGVPSPKPTINAPASAKQKAVAKPAEPDAAVASTPKASKKKRKHRDDDGEDGPAATVSTPVQKDAAATSTKKNTPAEKSAKKQKTGDKAPRKETPVLPPILGSRSNSMASAYSNSQPAPRSRTSLSPGAALPATQIPTAKRTHVPIPTLRSYSSAGASGRSTPSEAPEDGKKARKTEKKERKKVEKKTLDAAPRPAPAKNTPILPPRFDGRGRPLH